VPVHGGRHEGGDRSGGETGGRAGGAGSTGTVGWYGPGGASYTGGTEGIRRRDHGISSRSAVHARLAAEGTASAGPDQGPAGGGCGQYADVQQISRDAPARAAV